MNIWRRNSGATTGNRSKKQPGPGFLLETLEPRLCMAVAVPRPPRVSLTGPSQVVDRGSDATFTVRLSAAPGAGKTVGINFTTINGGARADVQYTPTSGRLTFTGLEKEKTIVVPTIPNSPNPTGKPDIFSVQLSKAVGLKVVSSKASAMIVAIKPGITVSDVAVPEGNSGTSNAVFEVRLTKSPSKTVTVRYATANDSSTTANNDYVATTGILSFLPGEMVKTVSVPVIGNTTPEPDKTFTLKLSESKNAPIVKSFGTGFILNDDGDVSDDKLVKPETVLVGDAGNPADSTTKLGAVAYTYKIGKTEQTVGDYVKFLNAVAKTDPYRLFDPIMAITRTGSPGTYQYAPKSYPNLPIEGVTWMNVVRFANWMNNGQGTASTETGAYELGHGQITSIAGKTAVTVGKPKVNVGDAVVLTSKDNEASYHTVASVSDTFFTADFTTSQSGFIGWDYVSVPPTRAPNANCWIPSRDEWYKAAYYDPSAIGLTDRYWRFATRSDTVPTNLLDGGASRANVNSGEPTAVGTYVGSASYYGTFDQTGNAGEFVETVASSGDADTRGFSAENYGPYTQLGIGSINKAGYSFNLDSRSLRYSEMWGSETLNAGFRLAYSATGDNARAKPAASVQGDAVNVGTTGMVPLNFNVTLSGPSNKAVLVRYATADGSATSGNNDYVPQSGYLIFAPGQTQKRVTVSAVGRPGLTGDTTFNLVLSEPVNATLRAAVGTGTIRP
jgi:formylglycine-generating enzyme required for sulfatase activity